MFFKYNNRIYNFVYYDEESSILLMEYCLNSERKYYKIDNDFFDKFLLQNLRNRVDVRLVINHALTKGIIGFIEPAQLDLTKFKLMRIAK